MSELPPEPGAPRQPDPPEGSADDEGPLGPFESWSTLYAVVVVYAALWIVLLYVFTVTLDVGVAG